MKIGIGLPVLSPHAALDWARRIDEGPFDTVTVSDRLAYDTPEPLITLAAVAGATSRVELRSQVLLAGLRDPVLAAKQIATLDRLSDGRLSVGIGLGDREDDYEAAGARMAERGRRLDANVERMRAVWAAHTDLAEEVPGRVGPRPSAPGGPPLLFGGFSDAAVQRVARWGDGYLSAMVPELSEGMFREVESAWKAAGREGRPALVAQANTAVGPEELVEGAKERIARYYSFLDDSEAPFTGAMVADYTLSTPERVRHVLDTCGAAGADEMVFLCWSPDPGQLDVIAEALG
ncbi:LLM class flavin-dependent oxidoreductase [Streptomyces sp. S07_1.15]|uniref:LLM class flavin-dependent oxidoreductase n=1 Tax=Streptomyces sp. S07_1.15 TaxID=2873925 RepID=UPI001D149ED8|nr:LLM class flavin-dependent oxidoreductase [Streptomyces sp. S07_1.15]MCC3653745.1 LLM class flavin-dependent oxidoreductase [Streptomyces sp. S07_1.15]